MQVGLTQLATSVLGPLLNESNESVCMYRVYRAPRSLDSRVSLRLFWISVWASQPNVDSVVESRWIVYNGPEKAGDSQV